MGCTKYADAVVMTALVTSFFLGVALTMIVLDFLRWRARGYRG